MKNLAIEELKSVTLDAADYWLIEFHYAKNKVLEEKSLKEKKIGHLLL